MDQIDYFKGVSNQEFIDYYKIDLYSRMEITLYTYPHEQIEEDPRPMEHLDRCKLILFEYLYNSYESAKYERYLEVKNQKSEIHTLSDDKQQSSSSEIEPAPVETSEERNRRYAIEQHQRNEIVKAKMQELSPLLNEVIDEYLQKVKITLEDL